MQDRSTELTGRVALVTGSTRGLGKAIALELARRGARVAMNYANSKPTADRAFAELAAVSPQSCLAPGDVTDPDAVASLCREVERRLGPIDILVVNATCPQPMLPIEEYDWDVFARMHDFFVKSPVLLAKACLPHMKQQRWGRIVQITSEVFQMGWANFSAYASAKGGQVGLARSLARELAPWGVTVNMVAPGWIPVERHADEPQEAKDAYLAGVPARRWGSPADVAAAVAYLASDAAGFVMGQTVTVNGGHTVW
ncbi:MAG TPA: 3-oxoacyl-ACP reductase family protein [Lacipirellulaceae bacterium]|mgnify:CR=1 FL=1|nr:3-oxoacyl-ACP reductase family protein [Lacipirellulaceae bacterium]